MCIWKLPGVRRNEVSVARVEEPTLHSPGVSPVDQRRGFRHIKSPMPASQSLDPKNISGQRPTWAEIDPDALAANFHVIKRHVGPKINVMAIVKANAYGHGAVACARRLVECGKP